MYLKMIQKKMPRAVQATGLAVLQRIGRCTHCRFL